MCKADSAALRGVQGAFGRQALGVTSFFTYVGLGLGFLGSALALPFGLYILILQREPESTLQDSVTNPSSNRQARYPHRLPPPRGPPTGLRHPLLRPRSRRRPLLQAPLSGRKKHLGRTSILRHT